MKIITFIAIGVASYNAVCADIARAEGDRLTNTGPKVGTVTVKATPQNFSNPIGTGSFKGIRATSIDSEATPDVDTDLLPPPATPYPGTYATKQTRATGIKFDPQSKVTAATTRVTTTTVSWSATPATFGIGVLAPTGTSGETATAIWTVIDPLSISAGPGDQLELSFTPGDTWGFIYPDKSLNYRASTSAVGEVDSTLPGHSVLLQWSISMSTDNPGVEKVDFVSDPALGLNDLLVTDDILSRYSYDSTTGDYTFNDSGFALEGVLDISSGPLTYTVTSSMGNELDASTVPEPSTWAMILIGFAGLCFAGYRSTRRCAAVGART